ncbi:MAG: 4'-phosphopantetheinyl transferase [Actinobacteria bacterium]|nr:4'-phosphopantetheinyl transferase [Actinomycetota bacterium]
MPGPSPDELAAEGAAALADLFPPFVRVALVPVADRRCPWPEEEAAVARAVPSRRREFLSGRAAAHAALAAIGRDQGPVEVGPRRQPRWPAGVVGSIAHAGAWAGAVVAGSEHARGLGLDIEVLDPPLPDDVERAVAGPLVAEPTGHPLDAYATKVAFSVREAVFKCLFPFTEWLLEPTDVAVELDLREGRYRAVVSDRFRRAESVLPAIQEATIAGRFAVIAGHLLTGAWVQAGGASAGGPVPT